MRVFVDSSVLIEHMKKRRPELFNALTGNSQLELCISSEVYSEYHYQFLAFMGQRAPMSSKQSGKIPELYEQNAILPVETDFTFLPDSAAIAARAKELAKRHGLLPNDSLILATCLEYGVPALATFDISDFAAPCARSGMLLLAEAAQVGGLA